MGASIILALVLQPGLISKEYVSGNTMWEETPADQTMRKMQKEPFPLIRFNCWDVTRFPKSTTYMYNTPYGFIQQGQYQVQGNHYYFHALMANDLENSDIARIRGVLAPKAAKDLGDNYAAAMQDFEATYDDNDKSLHMVYNGGGKLTVRATLYTVDSGDDALGSPADSGERMLVGLWHAPEPFPDRLDARVRYKIGDMDGLGQFAKEAAASEGAQIAIMDLRANFSFRLHDKVGNWQRNGGTVTLTYEHEKMVLAISADGSKLLGPGGKAVYVRN